MGNRVVRGRLDDKVPEAHHLEFNDVGVLTVGSGHCGLEDYGQ